MYSMYASEILGNQGKEENMLGCIALFDGKEQMSSKGEMDPLLFVQVL